jgi:hypothetical protein
MASNKSLNSHSRDVVMVTPPVNRILAFTNRTLTAEDFTNVGRQVISVILNECISDQWQQILEKVADLTEVTYSATIKDDTAAETRVG